MIILLSFCIIFLLTIVEQKLIGSTTLKHTDVIELDNKNETYTVWIQIRHQVFSQMAIQNSIFPLAITDQMNNLQLLLKIKRENQFLKIIFISEDKNEEYFSQLSIQDIEVQWIKYQIHREICFSRIVGFDLDVLKECNQSFKATLFLTQIKPIKILIYDCDQFENEYTITSLPFKEHFFVIDVYKEELQILTYVKLYCYSEWEQTILSLLQQEFIIEIILKQDILIIHLFHIQHQQQYKINYIQIQQCEQWNRIVLSFEGSNIILQIHLNDQVFQEIINLEQYQIKYSYIELQYKSNTPIGYYNSVAIYSKLLVIHKINTNIDQNYNFCDPQCQECMGFQCLNHCKIGEYLNETIQTCQKLENSIFYKFFLTQQLELDNRNNMIDKCENCLLNYDFIQCRLIEHSNGYYDLGCQFQELLFQDLINQLQIQQNIPHIFEFELLKFMPAQLIEYEGDFEIFTLKNQDIHLIYYDLNQQRVYCEIGFHDISICKKNMKYCWFQKQNCILCKQKYSFFINKCIKCQRNCLACTVINKKVKCILFIDNYFIDKKGLIQQCNLQQDITICQEKDVIIQNLINSGNNICQHLIYSIEYNKCIKADVYEQAYNILEYPNYIQIAPQKLEIQDMILIQNMQEFQNKEIKFLINLQQTLKIIKSIQDNRFRQSNEYAEKESQFLHLLGIQPKIFIKQKIILNVKIFLGSHYEYQNNIFTDLIQIYQKLNISNFKYIQYDLLIISKFPKFNQKLEQSQQPEIYEYIINYENYVNTSFIFNITFQLSPIIIFSDCNSFYFKANKVIINNLTFVNHSYVSSCNQQGGFIIQSIDIRILNIKFQKLEYQKLFEFTNFQSLEILNLQIYESKLKEFIYARSFKENNIQITNISIFNCQVWQFIQLQDVQNANITDIYLYQSALEGIFFQLKGELQTINLVNLKLDQVEISIGMLFSLESTQILFNQQTINNVTIKNVYLLSSIINKSIVFYQQEIEYIKLSHIYVIRTKFYEGEFLEFNKYNLHIDNLFIYNIIMIDSDLVIFYGIAIQIYQVFIQIKFSESSCIFYFYTGSIHLQNTYFQIDNITETGLLNIKSTLIILDKILFTNSSQLSIINKCFRLMEISSHFISENQISNIKFENLRIIDSIILHIGTTDKLILEKLQIINVELIIRLIKQLIQINLGLKILEKIYIINTQVNSFVDEFTLFQFNNQIEMVEFKKLKIINLSNQQPQIHAFIIKNEFAQVKINNTFAKNLSNIRLLYSESCSFKIINSKLFYIEGQKQYTPFIFCYEMTSNTNLSRSSVTLINNFQLKYFSIGLIQIYGIKSVVAYFQNIHFKESKLQRDVFNVGKINYLSINNISLINKDNFESTNKFLFYIKANYLFINQIKINSIDQQFLLLADFKAFSIKNVYVSNIQSNKFIELRSNISRRVIIFNIFIQNSKIFIESLFQLMLNQDSIYIKNLEIININVKNEIFSLNFQKQSKFKISDVIITNIISQNLLFYCSSNINYNNIQIINTSQLIIFQNCGTTKFNNGLITNIFQESKLSDSNMTIMSSSEIVNSNIIQDELKLKIQQSLFEGNFNRQDQIIKIYISLNEGAQMFKYKSLSENLFQVQFDDDNNYLYLPSGRDIQNYRYFYYRTQQYQRLYDSISFVNIQKKQQITCTLTQSIDNYTIVQKQINIKPGVNIMENLIFTLNPKYKDKHIQMDLNCSQNQQFITYRTLIKTFNCQLGEYMYKEKCLECNIEQQLYSLGYNQEYCIYKDSNKIQEIKLGQIKLNLQYWRFSYANKYIQYCPNENCLGGWQTGDQSCQIGYIGGICQECDIDNIRGNGNYGKIDNQCYLCYFDQKLYFKGLLLIIYQLLLVCISYYSNKQQSQQYLFLRISLRKFTELLQRQNVDQITILLKLYYNYLLTIFILKDLFNFGYIISISLNFIYNPNITAIPQFDCLINSVVPIPIQYTQLLYKIVIPLVLFNISVIIYVILVKFGYIKYSIYIIFVSLYTIYQQNQIIIIQSLIKLSSKVKYSNIYWTLENLAVQYYSQVHQHYMYVLILPLIFIFTLIFISMIQIINQRIFNKLKLSILIFRQYKLQFTFWDQMRTFFIYLFMLTFYSLSENYTILLSLTFATITLIQPFQLSHLNKIDLYIQCFSLYSYFAMLIIQEKDQYLSYFAFILSNSILLRIYLKYLQHGFNIQYRKLKLKTFNLIYKKLYYKKYVTNMDKQNKIIYYYKLVKENRKRSIKLDQAICETNSAHQAQELKSETNIEIEMAPIHYMFTEQ